MSLFYIEESVVYRKLNCSQLFAGKTCRDCGGSGYSFGGQCERCEGTGSELPQPKGQMNRHGGQKKL